MMTVNKHFSPIDAVVRQCEDFYMIDIDRLTLFVRNDDNDATLEVIEAFATHVLDQCARLRAAETAEVAA
jgi:hypothetical protein